MRHYFLFLPVMAAVCVMFFNAAIPAGAGSASASVRDPEIVLIVPARPHVLELAFDLADMRNVTVVSFRAQASSASGATPPRQGKAADSSALMHVWNGREWEYVGFDDFCNMRFVNRRPDAAVIIGDDQVVPRGIIKGLNWPCKTERLLTLNIADLINGLNAYFDFSSREWKRLAKRYDLKLEDLNAERRAYNPYDVPRSQLPLPTEFKQEKGDLPPAVIEKSGTNQPVEKPWIK